MRDYSVLVQGPLCEVSLSGLDYYKTLGDIVISHWESDDESLLTKFDIGSCLVVKKPLPYLDALPPTSSDTFTYQIYSMYYGLSQIETPYVIRTRSDERWSNLNELISKFNVAKHKIICGNIFFKEWDWINFHMGDHLFIGKTQTLLNAYARIIIQNYHYQYWYPEAILASAILDALNLPRNKETFSKVFDVVDINNMKPFIAQWQHAGKVYQEDFDEKNIIKNIGEL